MSANNMALTDRIRLLHTAAAAIHRSMSPACWAHSSKPAVVGLLLWVGP